MSINELFGLRGPVVAVSPVFAMVLDDDPVASLLFAQLVYWTKGGAIEVSESAERIYAATGISRKRQIRAREVLVRAGWITERAERVKSLSRLFFRVDMEAARAAIAAWQAKQWGAERDPHGDPKGIPMDTQKGSPWGDKRDPHAPEHVRAKPLPDAMAQKHGDPKGITLRSREDQEKIKPAMRRGDPRVELMKQADADLAELKPIAIMTWDEVRRERPEGPHGGSQIAWELFAQKARRELLAARDRRRLRLEQGGKR